MPPPVNILRQASIDMNQDEHIDFYKNKVDNVKETRAFSLLASFVEQVPSESWRCDILKMFNELYEGREYQLRVEFDMGIIQKKKRGERENLMLICKQHQFTTFEYF